MKKLIILLLIIIQNNAFSQQKGVKPIINSTSLGFRHTYPVVVGITKDHELSILNLQFIDKDEEAFANCCRLKFQCCFKFFQMHQENYSSIY